MDSTSLDLTMSTPALLFPTVSLLLLAYTNRFVTLANLIRSLHDKYKTDPNTILRGQIDNLRYRVELIKLMQAGGISSLFFCVLCMFSLFAGWTRTSQWIFGVSLLLMLVSLGLSLAEIWISVRALNLHLSDLRDQEKRRNE
ncbi:MAG: DUF2721 domain-containing protein [Chthoniobacteraceae bacterium]|nr:DUF2721 domain-containing protein [Chthoniobacteraceae bacterium]